MSVVSPRRKRAAIAARDGREFLRKADPVLARLVEARPPPLLWQGCCGSKEREHLTSNHVVL
jgi:hypothetical protein